MIHNVNMYDKYLMDSKIIIFNLSIIFNKTINVKLTYNDYSSDLITDLHCLIL
jgi:hypothetical protein